ncbi:hypothetical protein ACFLUJ_02500 [Chloroflexota bacterium]
MSKPGACDRAYSMREMKENYKVELIYTTEVKVRLKPVFRGKEEVIRWQQGGNAFNMRR